MSGSFFLNCYVNLTNLSMFLHLKGFSLIFPKLAALDLAIFEKLLLPPTKRFLTFTYSKNINCLICIIILFSVMSDQSKWFVYEGWTYIWLPKNQIPYLLSTEVRRKGSIDIYLIWNNLSKCFNTFFNLNFNCMTT